MMESFVGHDKCPVGHARFLGVVVLVCKKSKLEWEMMEFNFEISGDKIGLLLQLPPIYRKHQSFRKPKW